ncbi:MAG: flagellar M-ring protein FliF [Acidobacteria bacterium]|nr:MAG: flagellar M-ring protein FliF [Acidobacteriota bacterium]
MSESKSFGQVVTQIRDFVTSLTPRQRLLLGGGALLVAVVLFTFVRLLAKPEMTVLYSNMEPADAQALGQRLTAKNIRYQLSPDGKSVLVAADKLDAARLEIAAQGAPSSGRLGFELFDKTNWATSDFDDKVNYQRALEGELERTIQTMSGVVAARVHLAIPADSIYSGQDRQAKAGVILKLKDHHLSAAMRLAVQRLVASGVDKLDPQSVTVVDADAGTFSSGISAQSASGERTADEALADRLVRTLEPVVGADHVRATVHTEVDPSTVEEQQESYDPEKIVALTMQRTEENNGGTQSGGAAGTASNIPGGGTPAKAQSSENISQSKSENGTYAVNKIVRHSMHPAGRLKRLAVAVLVDDIYNPANKNFPRQKRSLEELKGIEDIAKASVGFDPARGDILTVQNISFQAAPVDVPTPPSRLERVRSTLLDWSSYVRIAALLLLFGLTYFLILRPVKAHLLRSLTLATPKSGAKLPTNSGTAASHALSAGNEISNLIPEAEQHERSQMTQLKDEISSRVKIEPAGASRLVQSWIREGERR